MLMTAIGMPIFGGDYEKQVVLHKILHILQSLHLYNVIFMSLVQILSEAKNLQFCVLCYIADEILDVGILLTQGGHKPGIYLNKLMEFSGNSVQAQGKIITNKIV